jgi:hypothetical protein
MVEDVYVGWVGSDLSHDRLNIDTRTLVGFHDEGEYDFTYHEYQRMGIWRTRRTSRDDEGGPPFFLSMHRGFICKSQWVVLS